MKAGKQKYVTCKAMYELFEEENSFLTPPGAFQVSHHESHRIPERSTNSSSSFLWFSG